MRHLRLLWALLSILLVSSTLAASVTLETPEEGFVSGSTSVTFRCSANVEPEVLRTIELWLSRNGPMDKVAEQGFQGGGIGQAEFQRNGVSAGIHQWTCKAVDAQGSITEGPTRTFEVLPSLDTESPELSVEAVPDTAHGSSFTLAATASDNVGVTAVDAVLRGTTFQLSRTSGSEQNGGWSRAFSRADYGDPGTYPINVTARDAAGNTATREASVTIVAATPPAITPQTIDPVPFGDDFTARALITDSDGVQRASARFRNFTFSLAAEQGGSPNDGFWAAQIPASAYTDSGTYTLLFEAVDSRGSTGSESSTVTIQPSADMSSPTITVQTANPHEAGEILQVLARIQDNIGVNSASVTILGITYPLTLTGGSAADGTWTADVGADQYGGIGTQLITYQAFDGAANSAGADQSLAIQDTRAPIIVVQSPASNGEVSSRDVSLSYSVSDASFDYSMYTDANGQTVRAGASVQATLTFASEGQHSITITAFDQGGLQSVTTLSFTIDGSAPAAAEFAVSPLQLAAGQRVSVHTLWSEPVTASLVARQESGGELTTLENRSQLNITQDFTIRIPMTWIGQYTLYVTAQDGVGNAGSTPAAANIGLNTITVADNSGPIVNFTTLLAGATGDRTLQFTLADSTGIDMATLSVTFDGQAAPPSCTTSGSKSASCSLAISVGSEGRYPLRVSVQDTQGFQTTADFTVIYDRTPPPAPTLTASATKGGNIRLTWSAQDDALSPSQSFRVYRGTAPNVTLGAPLANGSGREYLDSAADHNKTQYYRIEVLDGAGNAAPSNEASATAKDEVLPRNPATVTAVEDSNGVLVRWAAVTQDVEGAPDGHGLEYRVWRSTRSPEGHEDLSIFSMLAETEDLEYLDSNVDKGQIYYYTATAVDDAGNHNREIGDWSAEYVGDASEGLPRALQLPGRNVTLPQTPGSVLNFAAAIARGERFVWRPVLETMPVTMVAFTARRDLANVGLSLSTGTHTDLAVGDGRLYRVVAFSHDNLEAGDIDGLSMEFVVPTEWLASQGVRPKDMQLYARADEWEQVPVTLVRTDEGAAVYSASPPLAGQYALLALKKFFDIETVERAVKETPKLAPSNALKALDNAVTGASIFGLKADTSSLVIRLAIVVILIGVLGYWATSRLPHAAPTSSLARLVKDAPKKLKEKLS